RSANHWENALLLVVVHRGRAAADLHAARSSYRFTGQASKLDLLVGRMGRAHLAAANRRQGQSCRARVSRSETNLRLRRKPLVLSRRGAVVRLYGPAHGDGG